VASVDAREDEGRPGAGAPAGSPAAPIPVLFLTDLLDIGGAETQLVSLLHALDPARVRPILCILRGEGALAPGVRVPLERVAMRGPLDAGALARVLGIVRRQGVRAIYTTHVRSALMARLLRLVVRPPRPQRRIVVVTSEHSYKSPPATPVPERLRRLTAGLSDRVVAVSEVQAQWLRATLRIPARRVIVLPNAVEPSRFADLPEPAEVLRELGIPTGEPLFVCIARLAPVKEPDTLLAAMEEAPGHLILVGDGPLRAALEERARRGPLAGRVHFAGSRLDVRPFLSAAWAVCLSSRDESQPVAILEALAAGRPIVATRVGGIPEVVEEGRTGWLVPAGDPRALAAALRRAAEDPSWRERAGAAGRDLVARRYAIRSRAAAIEDMIARLVADACG